MTCDRCLEEIQVEPFCFVCHCGVSFVIEISHTGKPVVKDAVVREEEPVERAA